MRHSGAILFALGGAAIEIATPASGIEKTWTPPKETLVLGDGAIEPQLALGFSPKPTEAPKALFGRMMMPRDFIVGPATCGFESTAASSFTCLDSGSTCTAQNGFAGCCSPNSACSAVKTTCVNYSRSSSGACDFPSDYHTLCCGTSSVGECFTWIISTMAKTDKAPQAYTLFDCSATAGLGQLLTRDPKWPPESSSATASASASATSSAPDGSQTSSGAGAGNGSSSNNSSSTPVGAIAGGTVGGVVALCLIAFAIWWFRRKSRRSESVLADSSAAQPMSPTSPASGHLSVATGYQYGPLPPQPNYDPNMAYNGNQGAAPYQQPQYASQPYDQQAASGQYPVQGYGHPVQTVSPAPTSPSPGAYKEGGTPPLDVHSVSPPPQAQELPVVHPLGAEGNRAELPSS